jgi:hypothetical protein
MQNASNSSYASHVTHTIESEHSVHLVPNLNVKAQVVAVGQRSEATAEIEAK